jgi:WD40 repeat protein
MRTNSKFFIVSPLAFFVAWGLVAIAIGQNEPKAELGGEELETSCQNVSISPANRSFTADGGNAFINVDSEGNCTFPATSNAKWITVTSVSVSSYGGTVYYSVAPYAGTTPRSATISVSAQTFTVYQIAEPLQSAPDIVWAGTSHTNSANAVAFSPDGQLLASASSDRTVKIWRVSDGVLLRTLTGFYDSVTSVAFSHSGQILVAGSIDRSVKVWNAANWSLIRSIGFSDFIFGVAFSPDDRQLAAAGGYSWNWIHIVQTSNWQETALLGYGQEANLAIAYSTDGRFLAWAMLYPGVRLQHLASGSYCLLAEEHEYGYVTNAIAFSPDNERLASGSDSQALDVWDVVSCAQIFSLNGPSGFIKGVAYAPDGQIILAGGQDYGASRGMVLFWRVADGALLRAYVGQTSTAVLSVQFSPRGNLYAYARADGGVVVARNPFASAAPLP